LHDTLVSLLVAAHLICANVSSAAPLLSIWLEWREARGDRLAGEVGRCLLGVGLQLLLATALLGLLIGWLLWDAGLKLALSRLESKVSFGIWEVLFSAVLMSCHWWWWCRRPQTAIAARGLRMLLAALAGTNLLYHFPVLFCVITEMIHLGELAGTAVDASAFRQRMMQGAVAARSLHFAFGALASCGVVLILYALSLRAEEQHASRQRVAVWGGRWALAPTLLQIPIGLWVLTQLPAVAQQRLMGDDMWAMGLLGGGLALALWLAHVLATIALGDAQPHLLRRAAVLLICVIALMTAASRRALRPVDVERRAAVTAAVTSSLSMRR
jgi:hypothetical protein